MIATIRRVWWRLFCGTVAHHQPLAALRTLFVDLDDVRVAEMHACMRCRALFVTPPITLDEELASPRE